MQTVAIPKYYRPQDYERLPFTNGAVVALSAAKLKNSANKQAQAVLIVIETETARWRDDGGDPTTGAGGNGSPWPAGTMITLNGFASIKQSKWIGLSGSGVIHAHYYY